MMLLMPIWLKLPWNNLLQNKEIKAKNNHLENIETEELNVSVRKTCGTAEQRDALDVFGHYIAGKMHRLSSTYNLETMKIIEHEIKVAMYSYNHSHKNGKNALYDQCF